MANFARRTGEAVEQLAVDDDAAAYARAGENAHGILASTDLFVETPFTIRAHIDIIVHGGWRIEML